MKEMKNTTTPSTKAVLEDIKTLLKDPATWIQYNYAKDKDGVIVDGWDNTAVKWDLFGAMDYVTVDTVDASQYIEEITSLILNVNGWDHVAQITVWHDRHDRQHSEIIELLDKCISKCKA